MRNLRTLVLAAINLVRAIYRSTVVAGMNRSRRNRGLPPLDRTGRRQLVGVTAFVLAFGGCAVAIGSTTPPTTRSATSSTSPPYVAGQGVGVDSGSTWSVPTPAATAAAAAPTSAAAASTVSDEPEGEQATVSRVIDGDTFVLADGREVRVLGIDSCEMDTPGGRDAKIGAEAVLTGAVGLVAEPGVDLDRFGRLLRYVHTGTGDFGEYMVQYDHTGVYQGDNDASAAYLVRLYAKDTVYAANPPSGRECGQDPPPPPPVVADTDDEGSGNSGGDDNDGGAVYYANCDAVRAAGAAPIRRGDPGYSSRLDGDGDGQGCAGD